MPSPWRRGEQEGQEQSLGDVSIMLHGMGQITGVQEGGRRL